MRLLITSALATAMLVFSVSTASAVAFTFGNIVGGSGVGGAPQVGDSITMDLFLDTEAHQVQAWFLQVAHAGNTAATGSVQPFVFFGAVASPIGVLALNSENGGNASGQYAFTVNPPNALLPGSGPLLFGSIGFNILEAGVISIQLSEDGGAVGGPGGVDLVAAGVVTFQSITVPEPSTAMLMALGFIGLSVAGRRK
jgi:hypothetical protein